MPDDFDYAWLGWLMDHPEKWKDNDLAAARSIVSDQMRAIQDTHPKDVKSRQSYQEVVDRLEAAIRTYLARQR